MELLRIEVTDEFRAKYESMIPDESMKLFRWGGIHYMWAKDAKITKDNTHWLSEVNFGLRMMQRSIEIGFLKEI